jgi:hypothetical protein
MFVALQVSDNSEEQDSPNRFSAVAPAQTVAATCLKHVKRYVRTLELYGHQVIEHQATSLAGVYLGTPNMAVPIGLRMISFVSL